MRVGLVVYGDIETTSGGFRYDRKLIEGLRERGDSVDVISLPWRSYSRGLLDGISGAHLDRLLGPYDVLLEDELAHPTLAGLNPRLRRRVEYPIVTIVHHLRCSEARSRPANALYRAIERRYLAGVDAAVYTSEATRNAVEALADVPTVVALPAGDRFDPPIDAGAIDDRARRDGPLELCFLGSLVPRKGLETLIEGLARVPDERWRLRVVGDPTVDPAYAKRVRRRATRLEVTDRVRFEGILDDAALAGALRSAHVLAMPSTHEGFGIAYVEGMSFGLAALATTAGGAREVVTHGETGWVLPPEDPTAIAQAIDGVATDRDRLAQMGRAARDRYEAHPTWDESAARIQRFLRQVVAAYPDLSAIEETEPIRSEPPQGAIDADA